MMQWRRWGIVAAATLLTAVVERWLRMRRERDETRAQVLLASPDRERMERGEWMGTRDA